MAFCGTATKPQNDLDLSANGRRRVFQRSRVVDEWNAELHLRDASDQDTSVERHVFSGGGADVDLTAVPPLARLHSARV